MSITSLNSMIISLKKCLIKVLVISEISLGDPHNLECKTFFEDKLQKDTSEIVSDIYTEKYFECCLPQNQICTKMRLKSASLTVNDLYTWRKLQLSNCIIIRAAQISFFFCCHFCLLAEHINTRINTCDLNIN